MFAPGQNQLLANLSLLLFLRIFRSFVFMILKRTFEECVSLFSYQRSFFALPFVSSSFAIISCCFLLVKKFFNFFSKLFLTFRLISANFDILSQLTLYCQELFSFLFSTVFVSCNSDIIAFISVFVNYLFTFFYICAEKYRHEKIWNDIMKLNLEAKQAKVCDAKLEGL